MGPPNARGFSMYGPFSESEFADRFWLKVDKSGECWNWTASKRGNGPPWRSYGQVWRRKNKRLELAHRVAWELKFGDIPDGACVCHKCDNPLCCNPDHLWIGTIADNNIDRHEKGRDADSRGEKNGRAKLSNDDVIKIRFYHRLGKASKAGLARAFGVSEFAIYRAVTSKGWSHVAS
jgi:hypothetical protein